MGENHLARLPVALYGLALLMPAIAYYLLQLAIISHQGRQGPLAVALGRDIKGKLSPLIYLSAIVLAFVQPWISLVIYVVAALIWLVPDPRIEHALREATTTHDDG